MITLDSNATKVNDCKVFDAFTYIQHKEGLDLYVVPAVSDYKVSTVYMALPNKYVSYVLLKEASRWET